MRVAAILPTLAALCLPVFACEVAFPTVAQEGPGGDAAAIDAAGRDVAEDLELLDGPLGACVCLNPVPPGWQGPVSLWVGSGAPPSCGGAYSSAVLDGFANPNAPPAQCGCTCSAPAGATCPSSFSATLYGDNGCGMQCDTVTLAVGQCTNVQMNCFSVFGIKASPPAQGASCAAQPTKTVPTWSWTTTARACETGQPPLQSGCPAPQVCVPLPGAPMTPRPCIINTGDLACPAGAYSDKHVFYASVSDDRDCTACQCGGPTGITCPASVNNCGGSSFSVSAACTQLNDPNGVELASPPVPSAGGSCAASGGQPSGGVTPTTPTTVCCVP
jgi:hypothetical protein